MIKILMLDLGETLIHGDSVFPHVHDALDALSQFNTASGDALELCLVSDFKMPSLPVTQEKIDALLQEYLKILDRFELRDFFEPVEARVTLSTHVGVHKPDRKVFETAIRRLSVDASLDECLFITENGEHIVACRKLGMQTLRFDANDSANSDFRDWSEAPLVISRLIDPANEPNVMLALAVRAAVMQGLQDVAIVDRLPGGVYRGNANQWCAVSDPKLGELDGVHVLLPVELRLEMDADMGIKSVATIDPPSDLRVEAASMVESLRANHEIAETPTHYGESETHRIEVDSQGRKFLCRVRYSVG
ncbi:MAG: HAD family hydrolase [Aeoliella sp.]